MAYVLYLMIQNIIYNRYWVDDSNKDCLLITVYCMSNKFVVNNNNFLKIPCTESNIHYPYVKNEYAYSKVYLGMLWVN